MQGIIGSYDVACFEEIRSVFEISYYTASLSYEHHPAAISHEDSPRSQNPSTRPAAT